MQDLEITWPDGIARFSVADSPIRLGRSSEAAIALTEGSVSRRHLELVWDGTTWTATDTSTHGTFDPIGVRLAPQWGLTNDTTVRLGGVEGVQIQIRHLSNGADDPSGPSVRGTEHQPISSVAVDDRADSYRGDNNGIRPEGGGSVLADGPVLDSAAPAGGPGDLFADNAMPAPAAPAQALEDRPEPAAPSSPGLGRLFSNDEPPAERAGGLLFNGDALFPGEQEPRPSILGGELLESGAEHLKTAADQVESAGRQHDFVDSILDPPSPVLEKFDDEPAFETPPDLSGRSNGGTAMGGLSSTRLGQAEPATPSTDSPFGADPVGAVGGILDSPKRDQPGPAVPGATGGHPAVNINPNSTIISDSTLRLNVGGQDYSFLPGADVTIGRDPSCLVQLDERHSLVSRRHLRITFDDGHWWLEDFSSKGTYVNNKQLKKPYKAEGAFIASLGDDDAGTPMRIITAGEHRVPRNRNMLAIIGLAAAALVPLIVLAVLLTRNGSSSSEPDFAAAKQSTVMLFGLDGGQGSGFFVSDNLILTNQHVAVLSPQMLVGVSRQADEPAQIEYATELVANHPFLDLAVLRISNRASMVSGGPDISADPVGDINLPAVSIGDSTDVTIGDRVFNTGFPGRLSITSADDAGDLRLPSVVATSGEAANFAIWPGCSNPDFELFIPSDSPPGVACSAGGDLKNGVLLSSFFSSGQGASGSAVFHDNEVVAVVYAGAADEDNATLSITSAVFSDWLQEIIEQNP